ncbi:ROK family protein [Sphingomonas sp. R86521]|uniref:ROK family protein n=1 Tax=Sphingomonas sp. R86521 TaxID=3093860 RepID=UPI0036D2BD09
MTAAPLFGCIEAGGTKFVLGVARDADTMLRTARVPTTTPAETLGAALAFFADAQAEWGAFDALGIAAFGPIVLDRSSPHWGTIAETPKRGWSGTDLVGPFARALACPVGFDTDVNGAVLAESLWGAAVGADIAVYVTVGTGIGGGALIEDRPVHGSRHPEMGHMLPRRHADDRDFAGTCPFHGDCLEGLASGPAIHARWGASLSELAADHPAHAIIAYYLAQLVVAQQALLSPRRIILGGGVLATPGLLDRVRHEAATLAGGYFGTGDYARLIVHPGLDDRAGLLGALALAQRACR